MSPAGPQHNHFGENNAADLATVKGPATSGRMVGDSYIGTKRRSGKC